MTTVQIIVLVLVLLVIAVLVVGVVLTMRRRALRDRFGPESERLVAEQNSRTAAERELRGRERRHAELDLKPLSATDRARYAAEWADVQTRFVDEPGEAVRTGDELVTRLLREIGYPTDDYDERLATLSVEHARMLDQYREAHDISVRNEQGAASTEQLRQALVDYRALFADLLGDEPVPPVAADATQVDARPVEPRPVESRPVDGTAVDGTAVDRGAVDRGAVDGAAGEARPGDAQRVNSPRAGEQSTVDKEASDA
jgi:hypothetical protein